MPKLLKMEYFILIYFLGLIIVHYKYGLPSKEQRMLNKELKDWYDKNKHKYD